MSEPLGGCGMQRVPRNRPVWDGMGDERPVGCLSAFGCVTEVLVLLAACGIGGVRVWEAVAVVWCILLIGLIIIVVLAVKR